MFPEQCVKFTCVSVKFRPGLEPKSYGNKSLIELLRVKDTGGRGVEAKKGKKKERRRMRKEKKDRWIERDRERSSAPSLLVAG